MEFELRVPVFRDCIVGCVNDNYEHTLIGSCV